VSSRGSVSSRGRKRSSSPERALDQNTSKASKPNKVPPLKLRITREPYVEDGPALPTTSRNVPSRIKLLHRAALTAGRNGSRTSRSSKDDVIRQAALALLNMRTVKPPAWRQSTLPASAVDLNADMPAASRPDILGNEISSMDGNNGIITAAQTLMSMRHLEPPHGAWAWRNGGFRLLPHKNGGGDGADHALVISDDEMDVSDDGSEASLVEVHDDCDTFRNDWAVW
jgi:hypothetical protein